MEIYNLYKMEIKLIFNMKYFFKFKIYNRINASIHVPLLMNV